jgi:hypothetical protein
VRPGVARPQTAGEEVWCVTKDGRVIGCELRGELSFSRRCPTEAAARYVANSLKQDHLNAGWLDPAPR